MNTQVEEIKPLIERFREHHHAIASMVAAGLTPAMIRRQTGISLHRLTLYMADPTFNELIAQKAKVVAEKFDENIDQYLDLGMGNMIRSEALIAERLNEDEPIPLLTLDRISQGRADRFGYSKHSTMRVEHDFATMLDKAIARSGKGELKQIESSVTGERLSNGRMPSMLESAQAHASVTDTIEAQAEPAVLNQPALPPPPERAKAPHRPQPPARSFVAVLKKRKIA